jgi:glycosyltransferase involved in cell wall biosynthesis
LEILKKYPHIRYISEPDRGPTDAFRKGIALARGKYILSCYASDGYAINTWFETCLEVFKNDPEISLVCGLPQMLSEDGVTGEMAYEKFQNKPVPQKKEFFLQWLLEGGPALPEVNLCAPKKVIDKCYPPANEDTFTFKYLDWAEFNYNFQRFGYLACNLPVVAAFCRVHEGQLSVKMIKAGVKSQYRDYVNKWIGFRRKIVLGQQHFEFVDKNGRPLGIKFSPWDFYRAFIVQKFSKEYWRYFFVYNFRRFKKIPRKIKEKFAGKKTV